MGHIDRWLKTRKHNFFCLDHHTRITLRSYITFHGIDLTNTYSGQSYRQIVLHVSRFICCFNFFCYFLGLPFITLASFLSDTFYSPCLNFVAPLWGTNEKYKITNKKIIRITITIRDTLRENLFTYEVNSSPKINETHPDTSTVEKVLIRLVLFHRTRMR